MSQGTDNVGSAGRLGARYGTSVRRRLQAIEEVQFDSHRCPQCLTGELKRVSTAIWQCRKCDHKFAGGAYQPRTAAFGKAEAAAEELEEVEAVLEDEIEEPEEPGEPAEPEAEPQAEPDEAEEAEEPEPEEPAEPEAEPGEPDEGEDDDEPDSIESLFE